MTPATPKQMSEVLNKFNISDMDKATIRQILAVANMLEEFTGEKFVHLELGNPGIPSEKIGIEAQCEALHNYVSNTYPNIMGIKPLKENGSAFVKAFLNIDIPPECIVPTVGSMQGTYTLMTLLKMRQPGRDAILFLDPGFPAQHDQARLLGLEIVSFDIYNYRGAKLRNKLDEVLSKGNITTMLYSNPNNPAWTNLTQEELSIIGEMATKYDVVVLEDLAYMGMDFRTDFSHPYEAPYIPSVANYTDNYILLASSSKIFSYAGERIAMVCMSPAVARREYKSYQKAFNMPRLGDAFVFGVLYCASSGVPHSSQYAMAAMLKAATTGEINFVENTREYGRRANRAKKAFTDAGFYLVYDMDGDHPISDGFFFTMGYNNMPGNELCKELLRYGVAVIPLKSTGSHQNGIRIAVSMMRDEPTFKMLEERLKAFQDGHPIR